MKNKINVALLGGAFDPITKGHIEVAENVILLHNVFENVILLHNVFDEVWLLPCFKHIYDKKMVAAEHRIEMCKIVTEMDNRINVCDYEIKNKFCGKTFDFITALLKDPIYENYNFSMIIGLDNANSFHNWYKYEELAQCMRFVVVPRKGIKHDKNVNWYLKPPHIFLMPKNEIIEVSSTFIRNLIKNKISAEILKQFLYEETIDYIYENNLYV